MFFQCAKKNSLFLQVGGNIRSIRKQQGVSQELLALKSRIDRSYVGRVGRGETNVSILNLCKLAKTLKVNPGRFFENIDLSEIK